MEIKKYIAKQLKKDPYIQPYQVWNKFKVNHKLWKGITSEERIIRLKMERLVLKTKPIHLKTDRDYARELELTPTKRPNLKCQQCGELKSMETLHGTICSSCKSSNERVAAQLNWATEI